MLQSWYHGCLRPGNKRSQGITSHGFDQCSYSGFSVNALTHLKNEWNLKTWFRLVFLKSLIITEEFHLQFPISNTLYVAWPISIMPYAATKHQWVNVTYGADWLKIKYMYIAWIHLLQLTDSLYDHYTCMLALQNRTIWMGQKYFSHLTLGQGVVHCNGYHMEECVNSLTTWRYGSNFKGGIFEHMQWVIFMSTLLIGERHKTHLMTSQHWFK